jgi:hypothetical protein
MDSMLWTMEEAGEQYTVVFALIATGSAGLGGGGGGLHTADSYFLQFWFTAPPSHAGEACCMYLYTQRRKVFTVKKVTNQTLPGREKSGQKQFV